MLKTTLDLQLDTSSNLSYFLSKDARKVIKKLTSPSIRIKSFMPALPTQAGDTFSLEKDPHGWWQKSYLEGSVPHPFKDSDKSIRVVDLFSGIGGFAIGIQQLCAEIGYKFESVAAVDIDNPALNVYKNNHETQICRSKSVRALVDFRIRGQAEDSLWSYQPELTDPELSDSLNEIDLLVAGPPCQGNSNLNNHTRRTDTRNLLYLSVPAFAIACGAKALVIENVPSIVHDSKEVVSTTKALLKSAGYKVIDGLLAADAMGWPQTRKRHFLVARLKGTGSPIPLDEVSQALENKPNGKPRSVRWAIGGNQELSSDKALHVETQATDVTRARIDWLFEQNALNLDNKERPDCHKDGNTYSAAYGRMDGDRPAPTITTGFTSPGRGRFVHPDKPRTITPAEAARLQGFPDNYCYRTDPDIKPNRTQLSKWIGDAVAMPLGYAAALSALGPDITE